MNKDRFQELLRPVTDFVASQPVNPVLAEELNRRFPHNGETFNADR